MNFLSKKNKNKTFLDIAEDIIDSTPDKAKYPDIRFLESADFLGYFKRFLENIEKK